jgi:hypothetical protein
MTATSSRIVKWLSAASLGAAALLAGGFMGMGHRWYLSRSDGEIRRAGQSIAASTNTNQRAAAYADRADAYEDKARYSRVMKLIKDEEYIKLFDLALQDYN